MHQLPDKILEQFNLVTRDLQEVIEPQYLLEKLKAGQVPNGYWGTAPTGSIHIGYICPALKLLDIMEAGCNLTILIADIHAFLDNLKTSLDKIGFRTKYYIVMIKILLKTLAAARNSNVNKIEQDLTFL